MITYLEIPWWYYTWEHLPVTLLLYRDPNGDGDPRDAILLSSVEVQTSCSAVDADLNFVRYAVPPTHIGFPGEKFFVGALARAPYFSTLMAAADMSQPLQSRSWRKTGALGTIDIHDLASGGSPVLVSSRNWLVRAIASDCNTNGVWDYCDILNGEPDRNHNGIPDACENPCPLDFIPSGGGDGVVNIDDLNAVINAWGQTGSGVPADLDHNGIVNIDDLLAIILHWGPCS